MAGDIVRSTTNGDFAEVLNDISTLFSSGWNGFLNAAREHNNETEAAAQAADTTSTAAADPVFSIPDFTDLSTAAFTLAGIWLIFVLLTHTPLWQKIEKKEPPMIVVYIIGAVIGIFLITLLITGVPMIPAEILIDILLFIVVIAGGTLILMGLTTIIEKIAHLIHIA